MSARSTPYPPPGYRLRLSEGIWRDALATVHAYATLGEERGWRGSEALVYLGGVIAGAEMIVTGLYRLHHEPQGDRVIVTPEEARWLLEALRARDEKLIGQLHSHRRFAGHSLGDDAHAASFHDGFLSLVVPDYGAGVTLPRDCALLEFRDGQFVELPRAEVERRIQLHPQAIERTALPIASASWKDWSWRAFVRKLKSIALKRR